MITIEELIQKHKTICLDALDLVKQRGREYATDEDTLKTFREVSEEMGVNSSTIAMVLLSIKHKRLIEQIKNGKPITDSSRDLINYTIYVEVLLEEETKYSKVEQIMDTSFLNA